MRKQFICVICAVDINDILGLKRGKQEINLYIFLILFLSFGVVSIFDMLQLLD